VSPKSPYTTTPKRKRNSMMIILGFIVGNSI
jgi:hypothetical protein